MERLPSPWLPPLSERIYLPELMERDYRTNWQEPNQALAPVIGMGDFPEQQAQEMISLPLAKDGHLLVISSPGYGKSTFLQTIVLDLARTHNPSRLHVYLLDFGTNGLLPLKGLPHVADTMLIDEEEKVGKLLRRMTNEMKIRKKKLSDYGVASMAMYEKATDEEVPSILLVLDNYDAVREAVFSEAFEATMSQIAREGASIGIHLVLSAGRQNALRIPLLSNIKTQIALYMIDQSDVRSIVGRTDLTLEETPGRGLIKLEEPALFQTALATQGEDELQRIAAIQAEAKEMDAFWDGERPEEIPMMPEGAIEYHKFKEEKMVKDIVKQGNLPLGLEFEKVSPLSYDPSKHDYLLVVSDRMDGLNRLTHALTKSMSLLKDQYETILLDSSDKEMTELGSQLNNYYADTEDIVTAKDTFIATIRNRTSGQACETKQLILVKDTKDFISRSNLKDDELSVLLEGAGSAGIHFIFCGDYSYIGRSYDTAPKQIRRQATIGLMMMKLGDQDIFSQPYIRNEKYPSEYECYYAIDNEHIKVKIPK